MFLFAAEAENLLSARVGLLGLAELGGAAYAASGLYFDQFIDDSDR